MTFIVKNQSLTTPRLYWQRRDLFWQLIKREIQTRHKGSWLGIYWYLIQPLVTLALYGAVFGGVMKAHFRGQRESPIEYSLALFLGLSFYQFVAETLQRAPAAISSNPNFVKKIVFPLGMLPSSQVISSLWTLLVSLAIFAAGVGAWSPTSLPLLALIPVTLTPLIFFCLGLGWFLSSIGVFFRDLTPIVAIGNTALLFCSGVFYSAENLPPFAWKILQLNPVLLAIHETRNAVLWDASFNLQNQIWLWSVSLLTFASGWMLFERSKGVFAEAL